MAKIQLSVLVLWGNQSSREDCRAHGEVISLVVSNPRITEWLYAGNLPSGSSQMPSVITLWLVFCHPGFSLLTTVIS